MQPFTILIIREIPYRHSFLRQVRRTIQRRGAKQVQWIVYVVEDIQNGRPLPYHVPTPLL